MHTKRKKAQYSKMESFKGVQSQCKLAD